MGYDQWVVDRLKAGKAKKLKAEEQATIVPAPVAVKGKAKGKDKK